MWQTAFKWIWYVGDRCRYRRLYWRPKTEGWRHSFLWRHVFAIYLICFNDNASYSINTGSTFLMAFMSYRIKRENAWENRRMLYARGRRVTVMDTCSPLWQCQEPHFVQPATKASQLRRRSAAPVRTEAGCYHVKSQLCMRRIISPNTLLVLMISALFSSM